MINKNMAAKVKSALDNFFQKGDRSNSSTARFDDGEETILITMPGPGGNKDAEEAHSINKAFTEARSRYTDIDAAIKATCLATKLRMDKVLGFLVGTGLYIPPNSKMEDRIRHFIDSADRNKATVDELVKETAFRFCIPSVEARRLVKKWLPGGIQ